jgi:hypothetical protein
MSDKVRDLAEMGENLQKIFKRLQANQNLLKLLYYTDKDPLNQPDLTEEQIKKEVFEKLIKIVPRVGPKDTAQSLISLRVVRGRPVSSNNEFENTAISVEIFTPLTQWLIKDESLRPFKIMGEIKKSLKDKTINGMGKMIYTGYDLNFLTDEISAYEMTFNIQVYD